MRVLIADDSRVSRRLLRRHLESWGYEVAEHTDGASALAALGEPDAPALAILDWEMPEMNGIEVVRRLRDDGQDRHTLVYLLTSRASPEDVLEGLAAGVDDYLIKPVDPAELRFRLRNGVRLVELHQRLLEAQETLRTQAMTDPLTAVWNRRAFEDVARREISRSKRTGRSVAVLMIDLDHFKQINDRFGHTAGDAVLVETARRMDEVLRDGDVLGRFGGEEFAVLLPECGPAGAYVAGERVRRAVARDPVVHEGIEIPVTASIGVSSARGGRAPLATLVDRADRALYRAKGSGRNCCARIASGSEELNREPWDARSDAVPGGPTGSDVPPAASACG